MECGETRVYEGISEEMVARGRTRTFKQSRKKIKWLKHVYKRVVDSMLSRQGNGKVEYVIQCRYSVECFL